MPKKVQQKVVSATWPKNVTTLGIDIGGSGVKASVLDAEGQMVTARVRQDTPYPCPPKLLVATIDEVVSNLPKTDRVSVGFPGLVRNGVVVHVPSLSRLEYGGPRARVQTVRQDQNPKLHRLLTEFEKITGVPVLVNTSFNVKGEPIVETPLDALNCFLGTGIDYLALHDMLIEKNKMHGIMLPMRKTYKEISDMVKRGLMVED